MDSQVVTLFENALRKWYADSKEIWVPLKSVHEYVDQTCSEPHIKLFLNCLQNSGNKWDLFLRQPDVFAVAKENVALKELLAIDFYISVLKSYDKHQNSTDDATTQQKLPVDVSKLCGHLGHANKHVVSYFKSQKVLGEQFIQFFRKQCNYFVVNGNKIALVDENKTSLHGSIPGKEWQVSEANAAVTDENLVHFYEDVLRNCFKEVWVPLSLLAGHISKVTPELRKYFSEKWHTKFKEFFISHPNVFTVSKRNNVALKEMQTISFFISVLRNFKCHIPDATEIKVSRLCSSAVLGQADVHVKSYLKTQKINNCESFLQFFKRHSCYFSVVGTSVFLQEALSATSLVAQKSEAVTFYTTVLEKELQKGKCLIAIEHLKSYLLKAPKQVCDFFVKNYRTEKIRCFFEQHPNHFVVISDHVGLIEDVRNACREILLQFCKVFEKRHESEGFWINVSELKVPFTELSKTAANYAIARKLTSENELLEFFEKEDVDNWFLVCRKSVALRKMFNARLCDNIEDVVILYFYKLMMSDPCFGPKQRFDISFLVETLDVAHVEILTYLCRNYHEKQFLDYFQDHSNHFNISDKRIELCTDAPGFEIIIKQEAVKYFCEFLQKSEKCWVKSSVLKEHLHGASAFVKHHLQEKYGDNFGKFFEEHQETFVVVKDMIMLKSKKKDWEKMCLVEAVEFFQAVLEKRHKSKNELWLPLSTLSGYLSQAPHLQVYFKNNFKGENFGTFFRSREKFLVSDKMVALKECFNADVCSDVDSKAVLFFSSIIKPAISNLSNAVEIMQLNDSLHKASREVVTYLFRNYNGNLLQFLKEHPDYFHISSGGTVALKNAEEKAVNFCCKILQESKEYWISAVSLKERASPEILNYFCVNYTEENVVQFFKDHSEKFIVLKDMVMLRNKESEWERDCPSIAVEFYSDILKKQKKLWVPLVTLRGYLSQMPPLQAYFNNNYKGDNFSTFFQSNEKFLVIDQIVALKESFGASMRSEVVSFLSGALKSMATNPVDGIEIARLSQCLCNASYEVVTYLYCNYSGNLLQFLKEHPNYFKLLSNGNVMLNNAEEETLNFYCKILKESKDFWISSASLKERASPGILSYFCDNYSEENVIQFFTDHPEHFMVVKDMVMHKSRENEWKRDWPSVAVEYYSDILKKQWLSQKKLWIRLSSLPGYLSQMPPLQMHFNKKFKGPNFVTFFKCNEEFVVRENIMVTLKEFDQMALQFYCNIFKENKMFWFNEAFLKNQLSHAKELIAVYFGGQYEDSFIQFFRDHDETFVVEENMVMLKSEFSDWYKQCEVLAVNYYCSVLENLHESEKKLWFPLTSLLGAVMSITPDLKVYFNRYYKGAAFVTFFQNAKEFLVNDEYVTLKKWFKSTDKVAQFFIGVLTPCLKGLDDDSKIFDFKAHLSKVSEEVRIFVQFYSENRKQFLEKVPYYLVLNNRQLPDFEELALKFFRDVLERCFNMYGERLVETSVLCGYVNSEAPSEVRDFCHERLSGTNFESFFVARNKDFLVHQGKIGLKKFNKDVAVVDVNELYSSTESLASVIFADTKKICVDLENDSTEEHTSDNSTSLNLEINVNVEDMESCNMNLDMDACNVHAEEKLNNFSTEFKISSATTEANIEQCESSQQYKLPESVATFFQSVFEKHFEMYGETLLEISELYNYLNSKASAEIKNYCHNLFEMFLIGNELFLVHQGKVGLKKLIYDSSIVTATEPESHHFLADIDSYSSKYDGNELYSSTELLAPVISTDTKKICEKKQNDLSTEFQISSAVTEANVGRHETSQQYTLPETAATFFQNVLEKHFETYGETLLEISELYDYLNSKASADIKDYCHNLFEMFLAGNELFLVHQGKVGLKKLKIYDGSVPKHELHQFPTPAVFNDATNSSTKLPIESVVERGLSADVAIEPHGASIPKINSSSLPREMGVFSLETKLHVTEANSSEFGVVQSNTVSALETMYDYKSKNVCTIQ